MVTNNIPQLSIIIPVFNGETYLEDCLNSITNQNYEDFEVLLIDDGSTDNSKEIMEEYLKKDARFKRYHQKNQGVSTARNNGLKLARGKYIVFVDADDKCNSRYLLDLVNGIESGYHLVLCGYIFSDYENKVYEKRFSSQLGEVSKYFCIKSVINDYAIYSFPWNKIFRKDIIDDFSIDFDESISYGEDLLFLINYIKYCESFLIINSSEYIYRRHGESITTSNSVAGIKSKLTFLSAIDKAQNTLPIEANEEADFLKIKYCQVGLTVYRLMCKMRFSKSDRKCLKKLIDEKYQAIKSKFGVRGILKYYSCIYFPSITNFFLWIVRK